MLAHIALALAFVPALPSPPAAEASRAASSADASPPSPLAPPSPRDARELGVGSYAADSPSRGIDGIARSWRDGRGERLTVVALTSVTCPLCRKFGPSLARIEDAFRERGVKFVFVNVSGTDSAADMRKQVADLGLEGCRLPKVQRVRRLDIIVPVDDDVRPVIRPAAPRQHDGMPRRFHHLHRKADRREQSRDEVSRSRHAFVETRVGRDAGVTDEFLELGNRVEHAPNLPQTPLPR